MRRISSLLTASPSIPLGSLGNLAWAAVVAYAIVKHRLMDVDLVITRGIAYAAVSSLLVFPSFLAIVWLQERSFGSVHTDFSFAVFVLLLTVGVLFPGLRTRAESRIQQSFFRQKHEYRLALQAFARSIVRILEKEKLLQELVSVVGETLRLDRLAVVLANTGPGTTWWRERSGTLRVSITSLGRNLW
ncbi:MAG: hypothetical protein KatS3mg076_2482 [Candidatus Binatia bacterium]|nr:MAG: hypothetical protein KatS3mg076_2482 [Candidatus Binatia bacterium]